MAHLDCLAQVIGADRVVDQRVVVAHFPSHLLKDGNIRLTPLVGVKFVGVDPHGAAQFNVVQILGHPGVAAGEIDREAVTHLADQSVDRQPRRFAQNVPQTVVKVTKPAGRLIEPTGALLQELEKMLTAVDIFAQDLVAQNFNLVGQHGRGTAATDTRIGDHFEKVLAQRLTGADAGMGVLDARQIRHLDQLEGRPTLPLRCFEHIKPDFTDFHDSSSHIRRIERGLCGFGGFPLIFIRFIRLIRKIRVLFTHQQKERCRGSPRFPA